MENRTKMLIMYIFILQCSGCISFLFPVVDIAFQVFYINRKIFLKIRPSVPLGIQ